MGKFGFDEDSDDEPIDTDDAEDAKDAKGHDELGEDKGTRDEGDEAMADESIGPDDTFEFKATSTNNRLLRIPGSYEILNSLESSARPSKPNNTNTNTNGDTRVNPRGSLRGDRKAQGDGDDEMEIQTDSETQTETGTEIESELGSDDTISGNQSLHSSRDDIHNGPDNLTDHDHEPDNHREYEKDMTDTNRMKERQIPIAKTWAEQLSMSSLRFTVLHTTKTRKRTSHTVQSAPYKSADLDRELFGDSGTALQLAKRRKDELFSSIVEFESLVPGGGGGGSAFDDHLRLGSGARDPSRYPPRFQVRWGPNGTLLRLGAFNEDTGERPIVLQEFRYTTCDKRTAVNLASESLKLLLGHTSVDVDDGGVPLAYPASTLTASVLEDTVSKSDRGYWKLMSILFDSLEDQLVPDTPIETNTAIEDMLRRRGLSNWLKVKTEEASKIDINRAGDATEKVFACMTGFQIVEACTHALGAKNFRLATLIPLAGGDMNTRADLQRQIVEWREKDNLPYIGIAYRMIVELISGNTLVSKGSGNKSDGDACLDFPISRNLDWFRAFGLRLWYEIAPDASGIPEFL